MKRSIIILAIVCLCMTNIFARSKYVYRDYSPDSFYYSVEKNLGHKLADYETAICDSTYLYYYKKIEKVWNDEAWRSAVYKASELCNDKAAVTAAKAGKFGEKFIQATIVTSQRAINGFLRWIDEGSYVYQKKHQ